MRSWRVNVTAVSKRSRGLQRAIHEECRQLLSEGEQGDAGSQLSLPANWSAFGIRVLAGAGSL
jgi:hypothetical protein